MDRGAWQATILGSQRVGHDWAAEQPPLPFRVPMRSQRGNHVIHSSQHLTNSENPANTSCCVTATISTIIADITEKFRTDLWILKENKAGVSGSWSCLCSPFRKGKVDWGHFPILVSPDASPWLDGLSGTNLCSALYFPRPLCCLSAAFHPKIGKGS